MRADGTFALANGRTAAAHALWPLELEGALLERLALGDLDDVDDFMTRMNVLHLLALREADGLGPFLGGRVRLFPHQLYVAERASASDPVRWLLADEVGPRQDHRGVADPQSAGAPRQGRRAAWWWRPTR